MLSYSYATMSGTLLYWNNIGGENSSADNVVVVTSSFSSEQNAKHSSSEESNQMPPNPPCRHTTLNEDDAATRDSDCGNEESSFCSNHPWIVLLFIFFGYTALLYFVYLSMPDLDEEERQHLKMPWSLQEAKNLGMVLERYKGDHYWTVLLGVVLVYIFLQTFAIPGSLFLSLLAGFLFPFFPALLLVCACASTGASFCYALSWLVARNLVLAYFPDDIQGWAQTVNEQGGDILSFIIFLRITPLLPNWFINIASPLIGVPWKIFWLGTFVGVAPPSALVVQAGRTLNDLSSSTEYISWTSIVILALVAVGSLIPVWYRRRFLR